MSNILLAVDQKENSRLLLEYLERQHSVIVSSSADSLNEPFDLAIFDGSALHRLRQFAYVRKEVASPLFLPILLVTPRQDIGMITRQLWRVIDELIFTPIEKPELAVRIEVLLRARRLSLELAGQTIQLQEEMTGHQAAEQALRESEERFRVALKNSSIIVAHTDRDLRYTWVHNVYSLFHSDDILGRCDDELLSSENVAGLMQLKREVLETAVGARREIELNIRGELKVFDVTVEPIRDEDGSITGLTMAALDVTRYKEAEEKALEMAAVQERQRLARDLHDAVNQTLFTINVLAQSLPRLWEQKPDRMLEQLDQLTRLSQGAMAEMRTLLLELRPANLTGTSLSDLCAQLINAAQTRRRVAISQHIEVDNPLPEDVHIAFYRIIQEGLNNIVKHSGAAEASISLTAHNGQVILHIRDNGHGFNTDQSSGGLGLGVMRERAAIIGATIDMNSADGAGTEITVSWTGTPL